MWTMDYVLVQLMARDTVLLKANGNGQCLHTDHGKGQLVSCWLFTPVPQRWYLPNGTAVGWVVLALVHCVIQQAPGECPM